MKGSVFNKPQADSITVISKPVAVDPPKSRTSLFNKTPPKPVTSGILTSSFAAKPKEEKVAKGVLKNAKVRRRIPVTEADLQKFSTDDKIITAAKTIVETTNVEELNIKVVLTIGSKVQESHKKIIDKLLKLSQDDVIGQVTRKISRIADFMQDIDKVSFFGGLFGDAKDSFRDKYSSMEGMITEIKQEIRGLMVLCDAAKAIEKDIKACLTEIEPWVVAVSYMAEYKADDFPTELFISRLSSLMSTLQMLKMNMEQQKLFYMFNLGLIDTINSIVLTDIPMWCNNYISSALQGNSNDTATLKKQKQEIIQKLQTKIKNNEH